MVLWAANKKLKGVAELTDFSFDSKERRLYAELILVGEEEPVDVLLENFTVEVDEEIYRLHIQQIQSNRPWMDALLKRVVVGRGWKIPDSQIELVQELFVFDEDDDPELS